jgi:hypothetical protein
MRVARAWSAPRRARLDVVSHVLLRRGRSAGLELADDGLRVLAERLRVGGGWVARAWARGCADARAVSITEDMRAPWQRGVRRTRLVAAAAGAEGAVVAAHVRRRVACGSGRTHSARDADTRASLSTLGRNTLRRGDVRTRRGCSMRLCSRHAPACSVVRSSTTARARRRHARARIVLLLSLLSPSASHAGLQARALAPNAGATALRCCCGAASEAVLLRDAGGRSAAFDVHTGGCAHVPWECADGVAVVGTT